MEGAQLLFLLEDLVISPLRCSYSWCFQERSQPVIPASFQRIVFKPTIGINAQLASLWKLQFVTHCPHSR
jgi:hypothetical protein